MYTTVDAIRYASADEALVIVDHALRHGATRDQLVRLALEMENYPGIHRGLWAIEHGDPRAESALESLGRLAFIEAGRPAPLSNVWIFDHCRAVRVDHLLPGSGVVIEGDGGLKVNNRPDAHRVIEAQSGQGTLVARSWLSRRAVQLLDWAVPAQRDRPSSRSRGPSTVRSPGSDRVVTGAPAMDLSAHAQRPPRCTHDDSGPCEDQLPGRRGWWDRTSQLDPRRRWGHHPLEMKLILAGRVSWPTLR